MGGTNRQRKTQAANANVAGQPAENERRSRMPASELRGGFRAIGVAVSRLVRPLLTKGGGGILARLKAEWAAIVGPDWAEVSWPHALGRDGALKLRIASGAALELQHRAPLMIERINLFFGRAVVSRLALVQGPLPLPLAAYRSPARALAPAEERALSERLCGVADLELRDALAQLGRALAGRED